MISQKPRMALLLGNIPVNPFPAPLFSYNWVSHCSVRLYLDLVWYPLSKIKKRAEFQSWSLLPGPLMRTFNFRPRLTGSLSIVDWVIGQESAAWPLQVWSVIPLLSQGSFASGLGYMVTAVSFAHPDFPKASSPLRTTSLSSCSQWFLCWKSKVLKIIRPVPSQFVYLPAAESISHDWSAVSRQYIACELAFHLFSFLSSSQSDLLL